MTEPVEVELKRGCDELADAFFALDTPEQVADIFPDRLKICSQVIRVGWDRDS